MPWRDLEQRGWIAEASCTEVRVSLPEDERMAYATAIPREMYRIAAENSRKLPLTRAIMDQHDGAQTLVDQVNTLLAARTQTAEGAVA